MSDLASALVNETLNITEDVRAMYAFEKNISQVMFH